MLFKWVASSLSGAVLALLACASPADATDWWVAGTGSDSQSGAQLQPFRTITHAMSKARQGDVIKVKAGDYDVGAGESFPIYVKHNVDIRGQETSAVNYPQIGGDVNSSSVDGLFVIDPAEPGNDDGNRTGIDIVGLHFVSEISSGKDAPAAVFVNNHDGYDVEASVSNCNFDRSGMLDSGHADRPVIWVNAGWGACDTTIEGCTIKPTILGGILLLTGSDTTHEHVSTPSLKVRDCEIRGTGTQSALVGIGIAGNGTKYMDMPETMIEGNLITSLGCDPGYGIGTGFAVELIGTDNSYFSVSAPGFQFRDNIIEACTGDGMLLRVDPQDAAGVGTQIRLYEMERNALIGNGGAGIHIDRGTTSFASKLHVYSQGDFFCGNETGMTVEGETTHGVVKLLNTTIANNEDYGLRIDDHPGHSPMLLVNCILYFNNACEDQVGGTAGWDWYGDTAFESLCQFNDWQNLLVPFGTGNVDLDPDFAGPGDWHLSPASPCIDLGGTPPLNWVGALATVDIDGDDRTINGDGLGGDEIDMGADEYVP